MLVYQNNFFIYEKIYATLNLWYSLEFEEKVLKLFFWAFLLTSFLFYAKGEEGLWLSFNFEDCLEEMQQSMKKK